MPHTEQDGRVSVWLFQTLATPDDAAKDMLRDLCGVDHYDLDFQDATFRDAPTPVGELLANISYASSFVAEVVTASGRLGYRAAVGVVAQYDFVYDPTAVTRPISPDPVYVGDFGYQE